MRTKKIIILIAFAIITTCNLSAQYAQNAVVLGENNLQIYSPNTFAFARYGDIPVDYSTGTPNVMIPLMSLTDRDIKVDISLSYHATGIKVDQEATWVGLGWALNAGGVITHQIQGKSDKLIDLPYRSKYERTHISDYDYKSPLNTYLSRTAYDVCRGINDSGTDNEPDIYYYNFCGKTGKFVFDNDMQIRLLKYEDIKIELINDGLNYFVITDEQGIRYEFKEVEELYSWYLTKIVSPSGGEINFTYQRIGLVAENTKVRTYAIYFMPIEQTHISHYIDINKCYGADVSPAPGSDYECLTPVAVKNITAGNGNSVEFILSNEQRKDSESSNHALGQIVLYNNFHKIQKKFELVYGYFEANKQHRFKLKDGQEPVDKDHLNYRLRLESVKEFGSESESMGIYKLEYYGDDNSDTDDPYTLPYRLSPEQDHWGYYNQSYNKTIFPNNSTLTFRRDEWLEFYYYGRESSYAPFNQDARDITSYVVVNGGNREPHSEAVKAGTLNKIIYPTGGYTRFEFEPHDIYSLSGGLRVKEIESGNGLEVPVIKKYVYDSYDAEDFEDFYSGTSPYHTYYYNPYRDVKMMDVPQIFMAMGVPYQLASERYILRIDGSSKLSLGSESASYRLVMEYIDGDGSTEYSYSSYKDFFPMGNIRINQEPIRDEGSWYFNTLDNKPGESNGYYSITSNSHYVFPFPEHMDMRWCGGLLMYKNVSDEKGNPVKVDSICYDTEATFSIPSYKTVQFTEYKFLYTRFYHIIGGTVKKTKQVSETYDVNGEITRTETQYEYGSDRHQQITESRTLDSQGKVIHTEYYYPTEYGDRFADLVQKNILLPIDVRTYKDNKLISGTQIEYNNQGLPLRKYKSESSEDISFSPANPFTFSLFHENTYDSNNLWQTAKGRNEVDMVYLWSYQKQYPVAEIWNATLSEVEAAVASAGLGSISQLAGNSDPDVAKLRSLQYQPTLHDALVSTYTYLPLVGMTSETDSRGVTIYYEYDNVGRLRSKYLKENGVNRIIEKYDYHYYNQDLNE